MENDNKKVVGSRGALGWNSVLSDDSDRVRAVIRVSPCQQGVVGASEADK